MMKRMTDLNTIISLVDSRVLAKEDSCLDQPLCAVKIVSHLKPLLESELICSAPNPDWRNDNLPSNILRPPLYLPEARYEIVWIWRFPYAIRDYSHGSGQVLPQGFHDRLKDNDDASD